MRCNYKESLKLAFKNFILLIKIGVPLFLVSFGVLYCFFLNVIIFRDVIGIAFLSTIWGFFNIINLFNLEFYSSGWNLDTNCFEYTNKSHKTTSLIAKILFFILTTVMYGYVIYTIYEV